MTASTTGGAPASAGRQDWIDWLRNLAILYLFPFHTARIFDFGEAYYVEGEPSVGTTGLILASYWFMPLLFLLAGMASLHGLRTRSARDYTKERTLRLFVPLVFGLIVLVPPQAYLALQFHEGAAPDYVTFLGGYFTDWSDLSGYHGTFTPGQLWFLVFLFVISLGLLPAMVRLARRGYSARWSHTLGVLLPALGLSALSALPDLSGKNLFVFAGWFFAGFLLATNESILAALTSRRRVYLLVALAGMAGILLEHATIGWQEGFTATGIAFTVAHFLVSWVTILAILGYGRRYLNRPSAAIRYLNRAAFPVFVLHQTFVVAVGLLVLALVDPMPAQYVLIVAGSAAATFTAYEALRRIPALRFLLGMKPERPRTPQHRPVDRVPTS